MAEPSDVVDEALDAKHILASERTTEAYLLVSTDDPIRVEVTIREVTDVRDRTRRIRREGDFWSKEHLANIHLLKEGIVLRYGDGASEEIIITGTEMEHSVDGLLTHVTFTNRTNIRA